ncbi:MAG: biotin--[acetyl-CoA-carboxylase] ligase [Gammaproteobacteria bacterium]|nr:biotin--[acetyl-CoA-carboxylase] ligase [Gammaproteobacteria bacterium]
MTGHVSLPPLQRDAIIACLPQAVADKVPVILVKATTLSTNADLLEAVRSGSVDQPTLLCADSQSAGRGRRNTPWVSPANANIYLSLSWPLPVIWRQQPGTLSLAVGIAVGRLLQQYKVAGWGIKWPNDLWVNGKKIAGILIELATDRLQQRWAVIGIGLNVQLAAWQGEAIDQPWTDLQRQLPGLPLNRPQLIAELLTHLVAVLALCQQQGFAALLPEWQSADLLCHREILLFTEVQPHPRQGRAEGIAPDGALLVKFVGDSVATAIYSGSVRPLADR